MTQRTDVAITIREDEEGWYDVEVYFSETGERIIVDPRMVTIERDS